MPGWETLVVGAIVAVTLFWAVRSVARAVRQKRICSDCASSGGCPIAEGGSGGASASNCQTTLVDLEPRKDK